MQRRWWYQPEILVLTLLVVGIYFSRLTTLPVCGEESRRALVGKEMIESGDWIVPRQQGQLFLSRPPLQNWAIALVGLARGEVDTLAIRLPSAIAILLTTLLVYGYGRTFLSRFGALAAATAFATLGQVLQLGNLGETESLFALLVSGSLLVWHWGYVRGWPPIWIWLAGGTLAGLGALTKGFQAPLYFFAVVTVFLVLRREWRRLFAWQPLVGIAVFLVVVGAWQIRYYLATDWGAVRGIWTRLVEERLTLSGLAWHMVRYPAETLVCLLPWSPLLLQFVHRGVRESLGRAGPQLVFLVTALAVSCPSMLLAAGAVTRYYMPMYPCIALLIGLVIQRSVECELTSTARRGWRRWLLGTAVAVALGGAFVTVVSAVRLEKLDNLAQPLLFVIVFALASVTTVVILLCARSARTVYPAQVAVLALAGFVGLAYSGVVINVKVANSNDLALAVATVKQKLPDPDHLVSFGAVSHRFCYHYQTPIPRLCWPRTVSDIPEGVVNFCVNAQLRVENPAGEGQCAARIRTVHPDLPFRWEKIAEVRCGRNRNNKPQTVVVVGRIVESSATVARASRHRSRQR